MKSNLFVALAAAVLLSACQHGANTPEELGPGALDGYRVIAEAPDKAPGPRVLVIRPPNRVNSEVRIAGYRDRAGKLEAPCAQSPHCEAI